MQITREQLQLIKRKAPLMAAGEDAFILLDNHFHFGTFGLHDLEFALAFGTEDSLETAKDHAFEDLRVFADKHKGKYLFGHFSYDLKNQLEDLSSEHPDRIGFPLLHFFVPEKLLLIDAALNVLAGKELIQSILEFPEELNKNKGSIVSLKQRVSKDDYVLSVNAIKQNIIQGDVYELNYCVEFFDEDALINPAETFLRLTEKSPTPFSAFYKLHDTYLISASPERFLKLKSGKLSSQPIKGTIRRGEDERNDEQLKSELLNSEKERAENLMIVDLVRNDLARSAITGSVTVDELFGIYTFKNLHQMISTVSARIHPETHPVDAIRHAFPMGSMTGAPKIRAMELIETYEETKRGLYSGAVGYFTPNGDFDFNVVIRSIQYNAFSKNLSFEVGSAITYDSDPQQEYEECMLKASAIMDVLKPDDFNTFA